MATSWNSPFIGAPTWGASIGPWPDFAAYRVLQYVDEGDSIVTESRLVRHPDDPTPRAIDVRQSFSRQTRPARLVVA